MKRAFLCWCIAAAMVLGFPALARAATKAGSRRVDDLPLDVFQKIDKRLTALDAENQALQLQRSHVDSVKNRSRHKRLLQQVQHSSEFRARKSSVAQLLTITSRAEKTYRARHQAYGARLFRDLHSRLLALRSPMLRSASATSTSVFDRNEKLVELRMLSVVEQFQAISGGYAAMACHPGTWACCKPRITKEGKVEVRGCSWSCASKLTACAGGCLGPRIPNTIVAVKNAAPKPQPHTHRSLPTLAGSQTRKPKSAQPPTGGSP